jgi:hypothetical protein
MVLQLWQRSFAYAKSRPEFISEEDPEIKAAFRTARIFEFDPLLLAGLQKTREMPETPMLPYPSILLCLQANAAIEDGPADFLGPNEKLYMTGVLCYGQACEWTKTAMVIARSPTGPIGMVARFEEQRNPGIRNYVQIITSPQVELVKSRREAGEKAVKGLRTSHIPTEKVQIRLPYRRYLSEQFELAEAGDRAAHWVRGHWRNLVAERYTKTKAWVMPHIRGVREPEGGVKAKPYTVRGRAVADA